MSGYKLKSSITCLTPGETGRAWDGLAVSPCGPVQEPKHRPHQGDQEQLLHIPGEWALVSCQSVELFK